MSLAADTGLTPRLALLNFLAAVALTAHVWTFVTVSRVSEVSLAWRACQAATHAPIRVDAAHQISA
jgi:hypothetical protein